ncbi:putative lipase atg15 [Podochytrium sp. JEL0797]|nr:putative lipase atg15 [Podochytrium sp. JEL0797]
MTQRQKESNPDSQSHILAHRDILLPDPSDKETVLTMALMAFNAYYEPVNPEWVAIPGWNATDEFGSTKTAIRGYIFKSTDPNVKIATIVLKGTSINLFAGGFNDKLNDNKMFSCCCGKAGWSWRAVEGCNCSNGAATECQTQCVEESSDYKESYYRLATTIASVAMIQHPFHTLWVTGHSLGGSLASLIALTFDLPAITFETPGDLLFAKRIGLLPPLVPQNLHPLSTSESAFETRQLQHGDASDWAPFLDTLEIYQFGNDGDPIYLGTCMNGIYSSCWIGGYAIETKCHVGKECVYNLDSDGKKGGSGAKLSLQSDERETIQPPMIRGTVRHATSRLLASESINNHRIQFVIDELIKKWEYAPDCAVNSARGGERCVDCEKWKWLP